MIVAICQKMNTYIVCGSVNKSHSLTTVEVKVWLFDDIHIFYVTIYLVTVHLINIC